MRKNIAIAVLTAASLSLSAQRNDPETPFQTLSLKNDNIQQIRVETSGGNIAVQGGSDAEARIEVYIKAGNGRDKNITREEIQQRLSEHYDFTLTSSNHLLTAIARPKKGINYSRNNLQISFRIYTPVAVSSQVRTSGGNISLNNLTGSIHDFATSGGNLDVNTLSGKITGRTSGGNIQVSNASNEIRLSTSGGNIAAEKSKGQIYLSTSGGNLSLNDLEGSIDASTSGGSIQGADISGELKTGTSGGNISLDRLLCSVDASTSGGNIGINIQKMGKYVTVNNSGGNISLRMPGAAAVDLLVHADKVNVSPMKNFSGNVKERSIEGTLNGGGIPVKIEGSSGHVQVTLL